MATVISPHCFLNIFKVWLAYTFKWTQISAHPACLNFLPHWPALEHQLLAHRQQEPQQEPWGTQQDGGPALGESWVSCLERLTGFFSLPPQDEVTPLLEERSLRGPATR